MGTLGRPWRSPEVRVVDQDRRARARRHEDLDQIHPSADQFGGSSRPASQASGEPTAGPALAPEALGVQAQARPPAQVCRGDRGALSTDVWLST